MSEFNGYDFDDADTRKKMRYLVITEGDLDVNNAYSFRNKKELREYLGAKSYGRNILAVFKVTDITKGEEDGK